MSERPQNKHLIPCKPGEVRNPNGRPLGSRNKLGEAFVGALQDDFEVHGVKAIEDMRTADPGAYVRVIASILPKEFTVTKVHELSDDELDERIRELAGALNLAVGAPRREKTEARPAAHKVKPH